MLADPVTFCNSIGEVTWAETGNGYFLDPARGVLLRLQEYGVADVGADQKGKSEGKLAVAVSLLPLSADCGADNASESAGDGPVPAGSSGQLDVPADAGAALEKQYLTETRSRPA
ncbi:hypothetical protein ACWGJB_40350 [Streptomyces sp. NPDC054813]